MALQPSRILKPFLFLALALGGLLSLSLLFIALLFFRPHLILNHGTVFYTAKKIFPQLKFDEKKIHFQLRNESGYYQLELKGEDFCIQYPFGQTCLKQMDIEITTNRKELIFGPLKKMWSKSENKISDWFEVLNFQSFIVDINHMQLMPPMTPESETDEQTLSQQILEFSKMLPQQVEAAHNFYDLWQEKVKGLPFHISIEKFHYLDLKLMRLYKGQLSFTSKGHSLLLKAPKWGNLKWSGNLEGKQKVSFVNPQMLLRADRDGQIFGLHWREKGPKDDPLDLTLKGKWALAATGRSGIILKQLIISTSFQQNLLKIPSCQIEQPQKEVDEIFKCSQAKLSYSIGKVLRKTDQQFLNFAFDLEGLLSAQKNGLIMSIDGQSVPSHKKWNFTAQAKYFLPFSGTPQLQLQWNLAAHQFQSLVKELEQGRLAIPAPFHTLRGQIAASGQSQNALKKIPFDAKINLDKDPHQQIKGKIHGHLWLENSPPALKALIDLDKFYIQMPRLDPLAGIPPLKKDPRLVQQKSKPPVKKANQGLKLNLKFQSKENAIRLYYYLFSPYLGLETEGAIRRGQLQFKVANSRPMIFKYLARSIEIKKLTLTKGKATDDLEVFLLGHYKVENILIKLQVIGPIEAPQLTLSSTPSRSRDDIISLILYGKMASEISPFERENVGGFQAAISDRALGLFSIWAFASTPIKSIHYNPATKVYSAEISLPSGVSLSIGTDWEQNQNLSFKKSLGNNWWVVSTYGSQGPGESGKSTHDIFIQKEIYIK